MARRSSYCHLCNITNQSETPTSYVNGRPVYGEVTVNNIPCRFYNLKGPVESTDSGNHVIEITKLRVSVDTHITENSKVTGLSDGFERVYSVNGLPEVVYSQKKPTCIECYLKSVDGDA